MADSSAIVVANVSFLDEPKDAQILDKTAGELMATAE